MNYNELIAGLGNISSLRGLDYFEAFFALWGFPKATIDRIKHDKQSDINKGLFVSNKAFIMETDVVNLYSIFSVLQRNGIKGLRSRFIVIINATEMLAHDTETYETINVPKVDVGQYYEFFFPLIGREKTSPLAVDPVSISVASDLAALYNNLMVINGDRNKVKVQNFICFLVWSAFADEYNAISSESNHLLKLIKTYDDENIAFFEQLLLDTYGIIALQGYEPTLNIKYNLVSAYSLVGNWDFECLVFNSETKENIINILSHDWKVIMPEIIGAICQEIDDNGIVCSNYTSTTNIHKVIGPLYIDELYEEYEEYKNDQVKLMSLLERISKIRVIDPACGTGNYLTIAYKEQINLLKHIITPDKNMLRGLNIWRNFRGIESNAFAVELAKISFVMAIMQEEGWLASVQNIDIICKNPLLDSWDYGISGDAELYIVGNPPYKGSKKLTEAQKIDKDAVFVGYNKCSELDYAACWFLLATKVITKREGGFAFVTTNSLTQGQQVGLLWPILFEYGVYIQFAHRAFKWRNDANKNTAVTVVIVGVRSVFCRKNCELFDQDRSYRVSEISPYLTQGNVIVYKRTKPLSKNLPIMDKGNMPYDQQNLLLSPDEREEIIERYPQAARLIRKVVGSDEFINGIERWCFWITDADLALAMDIPPIAERIEKCKQFRLSLKDNAGRKLALRPHQFRETRETSTYSLVIPSVSSEKRLYIPIGFVGKDTIVTNLSFVIYDTEPWVFGVISSRMHNLWFRTVCGGLETRLRYSSQLGYNTFPFPTITSEQKNEIGKIVLHILAEREKESEKTLAQLYAPDRMSAGLTYEHNLLDLAIERCYRETPFVSDQERLDYLFYLYKKMIEVE